MQVDRSIVPNTEGVNEFQRRVSYPGSQQPLPTPTLKEFANTFGVVF
jgi:hypothetical protein